MERKSGGGDEPPQALRRYTVRFDKPTLGLGLQCGEALVDLPVVSSTPAGMDRPALGDVVESVNGIALLDERRDPYAKAIELITTLGRPITIGFIETPTVTYDLVFEEETLGISILDRVNQVRRRW